MRHHSSRAAAPDLTILFPRLPLLVTKSRECFHSTYTNTVHLYRCPSTNWLILHHTLEDNETQGGNLTLWNYVMAELVCSIVVETQYHSYFSIVFSNLHLWNVSSLKCQYHQSPHHLLLWWSLTDCQLSTVHTESMRAVAVRTVQRILHNRQLFS